MSNVTAAGLVSINIGRPKTLTQWVKVGFDSLECSYQVGEKTYRVIVGFLQRDPGERIFAVQMHHPPLAEERRLAEACGG